MGLERELAVCGTGDKGDIDEANGYVWNRPGD